MGSGAGCSGDRSVPSRERSTLADIGGAVVGAVRALVGLLGSAVGRYRGRWRLTVEADWGWIHPGNLRITVRNPGPRDARIENLYLVVRSPELGTHTLRIANLTYQGKASLPQRIAAGAPAHFDMPLSLLDMRLKEVGDEGLCRITPVVEDGLGKAYRGSAVPYETS
jgi:hypothetical protein